MQRTRLGFGCGSVLGRVGRGASLRAMNVAWDEGITLFDTARSYGFGEAEAVLGEFLRGKRDKAVVATKFGIEPQRLSAVKKMAVPMARAAMQLPGVRGVLKRGGGGGGGQRVWGKFSVQGLRSSLEESLRQLRTDYVDVLFLHEAPARVWEQKDLIAELDKVVQEGKVRRWGWYGGTDGIAETVARAPATLGAMQFGGDMFDPAVAGLLGENSRRMMLVANHPFGSGERVARFQVQLKEMAADENLPMELREKVRGGEWGMVLEAIFGAILEGTKAYSLVLSMMRPEHVRENVRAVEGCRFMEEELELVRRRMICQLTA